MLLGHGSATMIVLADTGSSPSSWSSAATCAACIRRTCASRSSATTTPRTCPPASTSRRRLGRVEVAYTPTNSSWLNRIEAQFTALRYFALDGTNYRSHKEQGSMIRRYIIWRNRHAATPAYVRSSPEPMWPDQRLPERPVLSPRSWF